jgi:DNA polymerase-3 subunit alpha
VFQVEGSGMRRWLMQMKPQALENVIAMVALFRPGPMEFIPGYIRRMHGEEKVDYRHPLLESIFKETYGYPVYQEQLMFAAIKMAGYTASEADDLRSAISKKIKDKLLKHEQKFIAGAVERGIDPDTATAIFKDWEEFARYGFNRSHAADYGLIAVETAYLKVHYPVEYMTALLAVSQNDTDKVALYVADCRRMGIKVEPPDINFSGWDFTIQDHPDGKSVIRFGLGAVKNVGKAPVEAILQARGARPFADINDLARRVDLRAVGKRSLECLIKVGALDAFGTRPALLAGLDLVTSISGSHFRAADMGQMSLFGAHTGVTEEISLPKVAAEVSRREILNWERELIGLYVSDHPLSPVMNVLTEVVTHFSGQLAEAAHEEKVRVAGLVTRMRPHQTKTGKMMGFVTLEDVQGNIELVVFPRTWEQYAEAFEIDRVLMIDGKVDAMGGDPKVLVDNVSTELKRVVPANVNGAPPAGGETNGKARTAGSGTQTPPANGPRPPVTSASRPATRPAPPAARRVSEPPPPDNWGDAQLPESFPPEWRAQEVVPGGFVLEGQNLPALQTARPEPAADLPQEVLQPEVEEPLPELPAVVVQTVSEPSSAVAAPELAEEPAILSKAASPAPPAPKIGPIPGLQVIQPAQAAPADTPLLPERPDLPYILSPAAVYAGEDLHMITVVLRPGRDKVRDNLRLRQAYGVLISYPGHDRFALQIFERGRGYRVEFPNFTTGLCPELLARLQGLVGADNILVEPLTIQ